MRTVPCHRLSLALLSVLLGWLSGPTGLAKASEGQVAVTTTVAQNAPRPPGAPGRGATKSVQAPPLPAVISTSSGDITIELFNDRAPVSVENFVQYANEGFYRDTVFHRVKAGFMIQGGGYDTSLAEKPTRAPIQNEATNGLRNTRGTVGMARLAALRSATSQFYINVLDNRMLDHTGYSPSEFGYAVFGRVLSGMDVVDRIAALPTHSAAGMDDVPVEPVIIKSVRVRQ